MQTVSFEKSCLTVTKRLLDRAEALSGGQRQRIALARCAIEESSDFYMDEATSQIDLQSERYIHQALKKFVDGRTTIMVTHRLSAIDLRIGL